MRFLGLIAVFIISSIAFSCSSKHNAEQQGQSFLKTARVSLARNDFKAAREAIDNLRQNCPAALNAREEGILLLDSIEINAALVAKDSLKTAFYLKKLEHDRLNFTRHSE